MNAARPVEAELMVRALADLSRRRDLYAAIGAAIDRDPEVCRAMAATPLGIALNRLGTMDDAAGLAGRAALYAAIGAVCPNLAFAAPGPVMAGFVVAALGDDAQREWFFSQFSAGVLWSFFALTERNAGSDVGGVRLEARELPCGGFLLDGEKYMIGQGVNADIGVVFARLSEGPFGLRAFLIEPRGLKGLYRERLAVTGLCGTNLSRLVFDRVALPASSLLGEHLRPAERVRRGIGETFDALRPCVAALATGTGLGLLEHARSADLLRTGAETERCLTVRSAVHTALLQCSLKLAADTDAGHPSPRAAGLLKANAATELRATLRALVSVAKPGALAVDARLAKAVRDAAAFEYAEGVSRFHRVSAASLATTGERHATH